MKTGFQFRRVLSLDEQLILNRAYELSQPFQPASSDVIYWLSMYAHGEYGPMGRQEFMSSFVDSLVQEVEPNKNKVVIGYGFSINPKGNKKGQPFHIDYTPTDTTIYIPLTPLNTDNSPEYLVHDLINIPVEKAIALTGLTADEIVRDEDIPYLEVKQLVARPYSMFYMLASTLHRGIPNTGDFDRVLFWIEMDDYEHEKVEAITHGYSTVDYKPVE